MCNPPKLSDSEAPQSAGSSLQWYLTNLVILVFVYSNVQGLLAQSDIRPQIPPLHPRVAIWFRNFGVFRTLVPENRAYSVHGSAQTSAGYPSEPTNDMVDLKLYDYFHTNLGEAHARVNTFARRLQLDQVVSRIFELHNETQEPRVQRAFIYDHTWPLSPEGFWSRFEESKTVLVGHN